MCLEVAQNSQENTCMGLFCNNVAGWKLIKRETSAEVFFYQFSEIFKNTIFAEHLRATAFVHSYQRILDIFFFKFDL